MTTPTDAVLDALNKALAAEIALRSQYGSGGADPTATIIVRLDATRTRGLALFDEIAAHHDLTRAQLAALCTARPTYSGGIDCNAA
jgi:hypothetical protein